MEALIANGNNRGRDANRVERVMPLPDTSAGFERGELMDRTGKAKKSPRESRIPGKF
jgi:hypothetical protein